MSQEDRSQIEELKKSLYSRNAPEIRTKRRFHFEKQDTEGVQSDWEHPKEENEDIHLNKAYEDHSMSFLKKLFIGSLLFFILAVGIGAYLVFNGANIVSANNIDIKVDGPVSISGGTPLSFGVQVINKNNIKLQNVDFAVNFPDGTVDAVDTTKGLKQFRELMDDIEPGGIGQKTVRAIVYGQENTKKEIVITISYQVKGSNAIFKKEKSFDILLNSSPLSLFVDSFEEVTSGQTFDLKVTLTSNSKEILKNIILKGTYPSGFIYTSSGIKPTGDNSTWKIGDIPPGGKKTIVITGKIEGQNDETRTFRFGAGAQGQSGTQTVIPTIGTQFVSDSKEITITKPFIAVTLSLDDSAGTKEFVGSFNNSIKGEISWFNNLPTSIVDGEINIKFSGNSFDKFSVSPEQGLFKSAENLITWNKITTPELANIPAGGSGKINFNITPRDFSTSLKTINNPSISMTVDVAGNRVSEDNVPENVTSSVTRNIKLSSTASLSSQVTRSSSIFENSGPIPPRAEQTTTYTILWVVDNTANTLSGAEVHASLPAYVKWLGKISPTDEDISYDTVSGNVIWKVGSVDTYTVKNKTRRQVAFQISLEPSVTQIGQSPVLINQANLTAHDDYTEQTLTSTNSPLNTRFSSDPAFKDGDEIVGR